MQSAGEKNRSHSENAARNALESLAQRAFTDQEWERVRARLLEYVVILRHWRRQIPAHKQARADSVVSMPEPGTSESLLDKAA